MLLAAKYNSKVYYAAALIAVAVLALLLLYVFPGKTVLSQSFGYGPVAIRYYGLFMAFAAGAGYWVARRRAKQYGLNEKKADDILFWAIVGGFIGARLYHVASSLPYYAGRPAEIFQVWNGGLSIYGAILGGLFTLYFCRKYLLLDTNYLLLLDWLTPGIAIGQILGRFGNLFNYELYGFPTSLPWKMFVPETFRPDQYLAQSYFHPLFLYEALALAVILLVLAKVPGENAEPGRLFFAYLFLYNIVRFFLEFIRIDSVFVGELRLNAAVSLLAAGVSAYVLLRSRYGKAP